MGAEEWLSSRARSGKARQLHARSTVGSRFTADTLSDCQIAIYYGLQIGRRRTRSGARLDRATAIIEAAKAPGGPDHYDSVCEVSSLVCVKFVIPQQSRCMRPSNRGHGWLRPQPAPLRRCWSARIQHVWVGPDLGLPLQTRGQRAANASRGASPGLHALGETPLRCDTARCSRPGWRTRRSTGR
jgi:hypothetical protein